MLYNSGILLLILYSTFIVNTEKDINIEYSVGKVLAVKYVKGGIHRFKNNTNTYLRAYKRENNHLPVEICNCMDRSALVLNPYRHVISRSSLKSIYIQCVACLAIAQQLKELIGDISIGRNPYKEIKEIESSLKSFCDKSFTNFDLRSYEGSTFLTKISINTVHVSTDLDGKWPIKLKEMCNEYVEHIQILKFYNRLIENPVNLIHLLCRGEGIFRNCINVDFETIQIQQQKKT